MPAPRDFIDGPWRAVPVLGITQILSWGTIFYTPVLIVPLIAVERGWSMSFAMGGFSVGLLAAGLVAPYVGRSIDRFGGHVVMTIGSLIGALGLVLIAHTSSRAGYIGVWIVLGVAMAANLYDSAFATLGRIFGSGARSPITALTLAGGFASTVSWPTTHFLLDAVGWRETYLVYAALLACLSAPLHALALPRMRFETAAVPRLTACRSFWWRRHSRPTLSCPPDCPPTCWRSSRAPASMPERWCGSARCSGRRRSARG
jgi:MFS family permease